MTTKLPGKARTLEFDRTAYAKNVDDFMDANSDMSSIVNKKMQTQPMNEKTKADLRKSTTFKRIEKDIRDLFYKTFFP